VIGLLVITGADTSMQSREGYTPLGYASMRGYDELVKTLLQAGANMDCLNEGGETALHLAAKYGPYETVKTLVEAGVKVNEIDALGVTALHLAAINGNTAIVKTLLEGGADPSMGIKLASQDVSDIFDSEMIRYLNDTTALDIGVENAAIEIAKILLEAGASGSGRSKPRETSSWAF